MAGASSVMSATSMAGADMSTSTGSRDSINMAPTPTCIKATSPIRPARVEGPRSRGIKGSPDGRTGAEEDMGCILSFLSQLRINLIQFDGFHLAMPSSWGAGTIRRPQVFVG